MTIDKIGLGKAYKKELATKKDVQKQQPIDQQSEKTVLAKIRGSAAAQCFAAMMLLASLNSCVRSEAYSYADNNKEMLELFNKLLTGQDRQISLLEQLLYAAQENNSDNKVLIDLAQKQLDQSSQIRQIVAEVSADVKDIKTAIYEVQNLMIEANQNDEELQAKINIIINSQMSDSEKLQQLIDLNTEQNSWVINIAGLIDEFKSQGSDLGDKFEQFYNDYTTNSNEFKNNDKEHSTMMNLIYQALLDGLSNDDTIIAKLDAIMNSAASDSEKLAKLIELVGNIDMKMDILIEKVTDMSVNIAELKDAFGQNVDKILAELVKSNSNFDVLIALQAENNKAVVKTAQNTDEIIAKLNMMGDKMFSLAELEAMLGPLFDEVADKITGDMISADELSAILEAHKTDLTKTNGLIENLTDVVKNLKLNGSNGISSEQMQALTDAIEAFRRQEGANDEAQMEAYQKIMDEIASLKGGIDAIANSLATANAKFTAFTEKADMYGSEMLAYMEKLRNGQADAIATIEAYAQKANDAAVQAQQARNEQIALLQALVNKEVGGNGGGLTKEELEEVLAGLGLNPKDYSTVLEEIRDAIGNVITSDDLQNFYLKTQPDLTKTNALIETLIDVLKNKKFSVTGDVNVNMLEVENLLGKIYDLQANGQSPNSSQIDELTRLVQQLVELVNGNDAEKAAIYRALSNNPQALGMFAFYDAVNALNSKVAVDKYTV